jgi:hypothetical protein
MAGSPNKYRPKQGAKPAMKKRQLPVIPASPLPPLYAAWIDQLLAGPIPSETDATCDDCAMLPAASEAPSAETFFNPETKCCSYVPHLANFLVGRILSDEDPIFASGRATVEARLRKGVAVTPLGLEQPPSFQLPYNASPATLFGQSSSLLCPHYLADEGGRCGISKQRASVCATWHCKYVRGSVGYVFWSTLHQLLSAIEKSLSHWCVLELGVGTEALTQLFPRPYSPSRSANINPRSLDGLPDPSESRILWGNWFGREAEFYRECARLVNKLDWPGVITVSGAEVQICAALLREAYGKLISEAIPKRLNVGTIRVIGMDQDSCRIVSYNPFDPISISRQLLDLLGYFDGRPTNEALQTIADAEGIAIEPALVRKLTDFRVLVAAPAD